MAASSYDSSVLHNGLIEHPEKIGIGTWDKDGLGTALNDIESAQIGWYYNWQGIPLWNSTGTPETSTFVPMVWDANDVKDLAKLPSGVDTLLGFNEPNNVTQANMSVDQALALWPDLMATGLRLGSPAPTMTQALGENSWLGKFMSQADAKGYEVDFIAVHYYPTSNDVGAFKAYLEAVHEEYGRPVWVTEWALADWTNQDRFSAEEQANFAREAVQMMDDLPFVERHAWFAAYSGGDGWDLSSECFGPNGELTPVGQTLMDCIEGFAGADPIASSNTPTETSADDVLADPIASSDTLTGTSADDVPADPIASSDNLTGTSADDVPVDPIASSDNLTGTSAVDVLTGSAGADVINGLAGNDRIDGKEGADTLIGGADKDVFVFSTALRPTNVDRIEDFNVADDFICLDREIFSALAPGKLHKKAFTIDSEATDSRDRIVYDRASGTLLYDQDGSGHHAAIEFAMLSPDLKLSASDFFVI